MSDKLRTELRKAADEFLESIREEVDSCVFLGDVDRLGGLVNVVKIYLDHKVVETIRDKGLGEELTALCDKAGRVKEEPT